MLPQASTSPLAHLARRSLCPRCQPQLFGISTKRQNRTLRTSSFNVRSNTRPSKHTTSPHHQAGLLRLPTTALSRAFHTTPSPYASPLPADALIERLTDLYGTARDEFEIAAEETEKKTVYAADDREAAKEAFEELKKAYEDALSQSEPEVGKEVQGRVGQRVRELGNALVALEESAMED